jgi:hypothetical protein
MNKPLHQFFTKDHHRLGELLDRATGQPDEIKMEYYHRFRTGLLRHIKMEEKILFPAAQEANKEVTLKLLPRYRSEHGALTALMVPPPTSSLIKVIRYVLEKHDLAEEEPGGLYDICEALTQNQTLELLDRLAHTAEVPVHPPHPGSFALDAAKRALGRAGYDYDVIIRSSTG